MKNSTLGRKPTNDMKKIKDDGRERPRYDQRGDGEDFAFNGQMGDGVNRSSTSARYAGNPAGVTMRENFGQGPRHGNASSNPKGTPLTIATASQGGKIDGGAEAKMPSNADKIYMPSYVRKGNS